MKRQYLGDSKDSFKWDYHHYLVSELEYRQLQVVWMMTADDSGPDGRTPPERFPAQPEIIGFCNRLRTTREPRMVLDLPAATAAQYEVRLYKSDEYFVNMDRASYFSKLDVSPAGVLFLDPDNGFEPEKSCSEKHVRYTEVNELLKRVSARGVISVFQHLRRKTFQEDFTRIRERLHCGYSAAVYWHSLMFVCISSSSETMGRVLRANREYAKVRPVTVLA